MILAALLGALVAVQSPDSAARQRLAAAARAASDSVSFARGTAAAFRADLDRVSWSLVLDRAARVRAGCAAAGAALRALETELGSGDVPYTRREARDSLRRESVAARRSLAACERDFTPRAATAQWADTIRAWGPYRTSHVGDALARFIGALHEFAQAVGIEGALR